MAGEQARRSRALMSAGQTREERQRGQSESKGRWVGRYVRTYVRTSRAGKRKEEKDRPVVRERASEKERRGCVEARGRYCYLRFIVITDGTTSLASNPERSYNHPPPPPLLPTYPSRRSSSPASSSTIQPLSCRHHLFLLPASSSPSRVAPAAV